ncbi:MAG: PilN domain-containing protein, partial [Sedimentisphaerales bacterium]|nr:PilN domain-containing protein [Sedimentisphaerales bacterium]
GVNFLDAVKAATPPIDVKKEIVTYSALAGALIVLLIIGLFAQLWRLEGAYADVKSRINETFVAALPQEKNIVSPLAQMEQKLASLRRDYQLGDSYSPTDASPLQVLRAISLAAPAQANLEVDNLLIADGSVRIVGTCDSFESVYQWQRCLQKVDGFERVEVKDVQRRTDSGLAQFTILISTKIWEPK